MGQHHETNVNLETATVLDLQEGIAVVECVSRSACSSCGKAHQCGNSSIAKAFPHRRHVFKLAVPESVEVGEQVQVGLSSRRLMHSAVLVYFIPLLFVIMASGLGQWLVSYYFLPEYVVLACVLLSLSGAFALVKYLSARIHSTSMQPHFTGKVSQR